MYLNQLRGKSVPERPKFSRQFETQRFLNARFPARFPQDTASPSSAFNLSRNLSMAPDPVRVPAEARRHVVARHELRSVVTADSVRARYFPWQYLRWRGSISPSVLHVHASSDQPSSTSELPRRDHRPEARSVRNRFL